MTAGDWPGVGPGVSRAYDAALDGVTSKRKVGEPGPVKGPGFSSSRGRSRNDQLYSDWHDAVDEVTFEIPTRTTVKRQVWAANLKRLREQLPDVTDGQLRAAFKMFADDIAAKRVGVEGKDAWYCFMSRWPKYLKHAAPESTETNFEDQIVNPW